jgi:HK97 family phage portal protein
MNKTHIRKVRLQERTAPSRGPQAVTHAAHDDYWYRPRTSGVTQGGVVVTEETSMTYATVWACVNKLSKTIATLPIHVKEHVGENKTRNATEQPLDSLLRLRPNPTQTSVQFREAIMANILLWGNAYIFIRRDAMQNVLDLWLLMSRFITVMEDDTGRRVYEYREPGKKMETYQADNILHIAGLSFNGQDGLSVIGFHRETVGVGMGATAHVNSFLDHGAQPGIVIERPMEAPDLSKEGEDRVLDSFDTRHGGSTNAWRTALLREGMTLKTVGMPLKDMEFVSLRRFQKGDIAGIFDVPLTKIHENERDTFSNVENKNIDWKTDSILPWCVRIENAVDAEFYAGTQFFLKHNLAGLARGDMEARYSAYAIGRQWGFLSANDIRNLEDMNPIEDGDIYLSPLNMVPADQVGELPEPAPTAAAEASDIHGPFRRLATEAAQRCVTKEVKAVGNAWKKHAKAGTVDDFVAWAEKFYDGHAGYIKTIMRPVIREWAADSPSSVGNSMMYDVGEVRETFKTLRAIAEAAPETIPQFLNDLNETFAISLVDDLEAQITKGV